MTDPNLKPEDRALIERVMGSCLRPYTEDDVTAISLKQLAVLLDAARAEGRRSPDELEAAARRLLACCEQPRGGLSRQGGEERAAMDGLRAILERRAPGEGTQVGRDEAALPEAVGEAGAMPGSNGGFTMAAFKASDVPEGTKLYAAPPPPPVGGQVGDVVRLVKAARDVVKAHSNTVFGVPSLAAALAPFAASPAPTDREGDA